ncbi:hypothetical protein [Clostridium sp. D53t1_180928_C8]|uniref:hypothetical protein n=1 Tax=Clostridium sp. D53t1_180928_C8 TaxID=2787101 RepID=UPI0018AA0876|nr:hypothetical protein [Clostridium sp. D53t1_180928_C8]
MPIIQTNVVLAEQSKVFFQEVEFDFTKIYPRGIFMVENTTEDVKVTPYVVAGNTIMFNAWITKNIAYKVVENAYVDKNGIPTVVGPIRHMTKVIQFGGSIDLDLPDGVVLERTDKAEVLAAAVIGSNDELLCPAEITPAYFGQQVQETQQTSRRLAQNQKAGYANLEVAQQGLFQGCSAHFEPKLYQYGKLREKMAIEILVKAVRVSHVAVAEDVEG